jgi:hypothetical protein
MAYEERRLDDTGRVAKTLGVVAGRRLTYNELAGKTTLDSKATYRCCYPWVYNPPRGKENRGRMDDLTKELRQLRETDPEIGEVLGVYDEIDRVYRDALEAMGMVNRKGMAGVKSSAKVTISFQPPFSTTEEQES